MVDRLRRCRDVLAEPLIVKVRKADWGDRLNEVRLQRLRFREPADELDALEDDLDARKVSNPETYEPARVRTLRSSVSER